MGYCLGRGDFASILGSSFINPRRLIVCFVESSSQHLGFGLMAASILPNTPYCLARCISNFKVILHKIAEFIGEQGQTSEEKKAVLFRKDSMWDWAWLSCGAALVDSKDWMHPS